MNSSTSAIGGTQALNAVGGMPRPPLLPPQPNNTMGPMPVNNAQLPNNPSAVASATGPNNIRVSGPTLNAALQSQQQQQAAGARSIRGAIADSASNLEHIVSTFIIFLVCGTVLK